MRKGILIGGMIIGLLMGCNNGAIEELEKKSSFFDSVIKIGHEFQEIFGIVGNAIGDVLGFSAVTPEDKRDEVGKHFDKVKKGLEDTNGKLKELSGKMSQAKNADTKGVEGVISSSGGVIKKLIESVNKLADVTKKDTTNKIGHFANSAATIPNDSADVQTIINEVKAIIQVAKESEVRIFEDGKNGGPVTGAEGGEVVAKSDGAAQKLTLVLS